MNVPKHLPFNHQQSLGEETFSKGISMTKVSPFVIVSVAAVVMCASLAKASTPSAVAAGPSQQSPGTEVAAAGSFLAAIKSEQTSIILSEPKCGDGTTLRGAFVMETPQRAGFPLTATTFASPRGTFTSITTTGDESEAVIGEIARTLNNRADNYVKRLLRNCSL